MSSWPEVVSLLAMKCFFWGWGWWGGECREWQGVGGTSDQRLTKCQADLLYYHSWPLHVSNGGHGWWVGQVVGVTGGIGHWGVHLTKGQPDPNADQMSSWPEILSHLATRCLYRGYIWSKVSLTQRLTKCQADLKYHSWPLDVSTGVYIWLKVSLTVRLTKCQADLK